MADGPAHPELRQAANVPCNPIANVARAFFPDEQALHNFSLPLFQFVNKHLHDEQTARFQRYPVNPFCPPHPPNLPAPGNISKITLRCCTPCLNTSPEAAHTIKSQEGAEEERDLGLRHQMTARLSLGKRLGKRCRQQVAHLYFRPK